MKVPVTLSHKPVLVGEGYDRIDGRSAYASDAKGMSLGLAQWNTRGRVDASAKVWRHSGERWSRQSEEMPLHRALDLAIFICRGISYFREAYRFPKLYDPKDPLIERIGLQGDAMSMEVCLDNPNLDEDIQLFQDALSRDGELLGERLSMLARILKDMGYSGN